MALSPDEQIGLDGSDHTTLGYRGASGDTGLDGDEGGENPAKAFDDNGELALDDWLRLSQAAESQGSTYFQTAVRPYWARNYRAFRSQHAGDSKYHSKAYKGRSKLFRPKTRDAVRKKLQSAASALFATSDVVSVTATNQADDIQTISAALKQEVLNYRLSRESRRNGVRWFVNAMGALQTCNITGLCISVQTWKYREQAIDNGAPDAKGGATSGKPIIIEDKPSIELMPPENCIFDPNCDWTNPGQTAQYIRIAWPMAPDEAYEFIHSEVGPNKKLHWLDDVTLDELRSAVTSSGPADTISSRTSRNDGRDPMALVNGAFGRVWLYQWFLRYRNRDYTFWTLRTTRMLSRPTLTAEAYPALHGERPVVIGYGALEAFRATPTSPVESWQPLQLELNDGVNLRLDHLKQTVSPPSKVKRGAQVDLDAVNRRGADKIIMVNDMGDIEWAEIPDIPPSAAQQDAQLNSDFDSLAGVMNMGTVQTSRTMNETVGGMNLLAGDSTSMAEFDLSVFVESWVDPVINQLIKLEEMYEDDETILALAGERAKLWQRFGVSEITDQMMLAETSVAVKIGTGSANLPMQRLQKFQAASQIVGQILAPYVQGKLIQPPLPNVKEIIETVFGAAGFSDGGDRFFTNLQPNMAAPPAPPEQQDPRAAAAQLKAQADGQKLQFEAQKHHDEMLQAGQKLQLEHTGMVLKAQTAAEANRTKLMSDNLKAHAEVLAAQLGNAHQRGMQASEHANAALAAQQKADNDRTIAIQAAAQGAQAPLSGMAPDKSQQPLSQPRQPQQAQPAPQPVQPAQQ